MKNGNLLAPNVSEEPKAEEPTTGRVGGALVGGAAGFFWGGPIGALAGGIGGLMLGGAVERAAEGTLPITEAVNEEIKAAKENISLIAKEIEPVVKALKLDQTTVGEIITALASMGEANVYAEEGLKGAKVGEHAALIRSDIDLQQTDPVRHWTNAHRMERGLPPLTKTGELVELHRIGQKPHGPFAELTIDVFGDIAKAGNLFLKATGAVTEFADFGKSASSYWRDRIKIPTKQY